MAHLNVDEVRAVDALLANLHEGYRLAPRTARVAALVPGWAVVVVERRGAGGRSTHSYRILAPRRRQPTSPLGCVRASRALVELGWPGDAQRFLDDNDGPRAPRAA